jgi:hypothetical protein
LQTSFIIEENYKPPHQHLSKLMKVEQLPEMQWMIDLKQLSLEYSYAFFTPRQNP